MKNIFHMKNRKCAILSFNYVLVMPLNPVVTGNSVEVMKTIAASGQGICFQIGIRPEDEPHLAAIPLTDRALRGRLVIGIKKNRQLPSAAAVFLETMKADMLRRGSPDS